MPNQTSPILVILESLISRFAAERGKHSARAEAYENIVFELNRAKSEIEKADNGESPV